MIAIDHSKMKPVFSTWKDWAGGACPVLPSQGVQVQCRNETREQAESSFVETGIFYEWQHRHGTGDIIAYRTVTGHTYRGWDISWDYGRFTATGPNYDASWEGEEDGWVASGGAVEARTSEDLIEEIDAWIEEHPEDQA